MAVLLDYFGLIVDQVQEAVYSFGLCDVDFVTEVEELIGDEYFQECNNETTCVFLWKLVDGDQERHNHLIFVVVCYELSFVDYFGVDGSVVAAALS